MYFKTAVSQRVNPISHGVGPIDPTPFWWPNLTKKLQVIIWKNTFSCEMFLENFYYRHIVILKLPYCGGQIGTTFTPSCHGGHSPRSLPWQGGGHSLTRFHHHCWANCSTCSRINSLKLLWGVGLSLSVFLLLVKKPSRTRKCERICHPLAANLSMCVSGAHC